MNVQFKKGVLELCVLVLLDKQDRYGYELVRNISNRIEISEGSVYPLLRRLTKEEYFTTYLQESSEGPSRKYYTLTDKGRTYLYQLLEEWNEFSQGVNQLIKEGVSNDENEFLQQLNASLKRLSDKERADILKDYEEHFTFGLEEGKSEEEIAASLGSPAQIAKELLADYHIEKVTASATTGNVFRAIWAVIGLGFSICSSYLYLQLH